MTVTDPLTATDTLLEIITERGIGKEIDDLSEALNTESTLTDAERYILATDELFSFLVLQALAAGVDPEDTETFAYYVLDLLRQDDGLLEALAQALVDQWETDRMVSLQADAKTTLVEQLALEGLRVDVSLDDQLDELYERAVAVGKLPTYVDEYFDKEPGLAGRRDEDDYATLKTAMVDYLLQQRVVPPSVTEVADIGGGEYDEFFGAAYDAALKITEGGTDPLSAVRTLGATADWDYQVDLFESSEEQGILADNIRMAGAIDYIFWLGDVLGVFKIVDAIVLAWGKGQIDLSVTSASKLYRYMKLRDERSTMDDRMLLYKRVLYRGDMQAMDGMVANEAFPTLWLKLMTEVARYIDKAEASTDSAVSTTSIEQAIQDLQYNLTQFATGFATVQVGEIHAQLTEAFEILEDDEILDYFAGGRRKNMWTVIERVSSEEFGIPVNVSALRTIAVEGNRIFNVIADYESTRGLENDSSGKPALLETCEKLIIAQSEVEAPTSGEEQSEELLEAGSATNGTGGNGFDDWEI